MFVWKVEEELEARLGGGCGRRGGGSFLVVVVVVAAAAVEKTNTAQINDMDCRNAKCACLAGCGCQVSWGGGERKGRRKKETEKAAAGQEIKIVAHFLLPAGCLFM